MKGVNKTMDVLYIDEDQKLLKGLKGENRKGICFHTRNSMLQALNDLGLSDYDFVLIGSNGSSLQKLKKKSRNLIDFLEEYNYDYSYYIENEFEDDRTISKKTTPPLKLADKLSKKQEK